MIDRKTILLALFLKLFILFLLILLFEIFFQNWMVVLVDSLV